MSPQSATHGRIELANVAMRRFVVHADAWQQRKPWFALPIAVAKKFSDDKAGNLADLIAYFGFFSLLPLLIAFGAVLSFVVGDHPALERHVLSTAERSFPALSGYLGNHLSGSGTALGVGLFGALWAGLKVTTATERALNAIWDIPADEGPSFWKVRLRGLAMLCILGVTVIVSTALSGLSTSGTFGAIGRAVEVGGALLLNFVLYVLAFEVLTNRRLSVRRIVPGSVTGAMGWTLLQQLGGYFTKYEILRTSHLYGSLGIIVALLLWMFLGAQLTLFSAELNVVLAARLWPRSLSGVHTDADRRALLRLATRTARSGEESVSVSFENNEGRRDPDDDQKGNAKGSSASGCGAGRRPGNEVREKPRPRGSDTG